MEFEFLLLLCVPLRTSARGPSVDVSAGLAERYERSTRLTKLSIENSGVPKKSNGWLLS
jgi:hypothetical protein